MDSVRSLRHFAETDTTETAGYDRNVPIKNSIIHF